MTGAKQIFAVFALLAALATPSASRAEDESRFSGVAQLDLTNA